MRIDTSKFLLYSPLFDGHYVKNINNLNRDFETRPPRIYIHPHRSKTLQ